MKIEVIGSINRNYVNSVLKKVKNLIKIPKNTEIFFVENIDKCNEVLADVPKDVRDLFTRICAIEKTSFALRHKNKDFIIISITKDKRYLLRDKDALVGILLHEIMHLIQIEIGLYKQLLNSYDKTFIKNFKVLKKLPYSYFKLKKLFMNVGLTTVFLLKDLYCNSEIIKNGYGRYLLRYYDQEFKHKKTCPRPVFYDKFKKAAKRDMKIIEIVLDFEFSLLSVILPFSKYEGHKADRLIEHLGRCYELNIHDVARKCHELIGLYLNEFSYDTRFQERFLNSVFNKVYMLLV